MPPRLPPGPDGNHFRHLWERLTRYDLLLERLYRDYGGIVAFGLPSQRVTVVFAPELVQQVLVDKRSSFEKGPGYKRSNVLGGPTILTADGDDHRRRRKLVQPSFHRKALTSYAEVMLQEADIRACGWRDGQVLDLDDEMHGLAVNIAAKTFFGRDSRVDPQVVKEVLDGVAWDFLLNLAPLGGLIRRLPLRQNRRAARAIAALDREIHAIIAAARDASQERVDLISLLVRARDEEGEFASFDDSEVRDEAYIILMAGHETTATGLTWTFYHLDRNPEARRRIESELDEVLGGRLPTLDDLDKLVYTGMAFDESLRLCPPVYLLGRRALEDVAIGEWLIPAGTVVQVCLLAAHRDQRSFPQPDQFRPERWLEDDVQGRHKFAYFPFGGGDRICIAGAFGRMEAKLILATLLQRWRIETVSKTPAEVDPLMFYRVKGGISVRVTKRRLEGETVLEPSSTSEVTRPDADPSG